LNETAIKSYIDYKEYLRPSTNLCKRSSNKSIVLQHNDKSEINLNTLIRNAGISYFAGIRSLWKRPVSRGRPSLITNHEPCIQLAQIIK